MIGIGVKIIPFISKVARAAADYYNRITADGGVSESPDCVNSGMSDLDRQNLLNNASLLLIPSGYKGGKLYSEIPTNGNGDLTWTRGSDAFRTNASGVLQRVPWNLATNSENFSALYSGINATISNNTTSAPNATTTADSLLETTATDIHAIYADYTQQSGVQYTYSVYVKSISGRNVRISGSSGFSGPIALVDLSNGSLLSGSTGASVESVGNGWYRISLTATTTTTTVRVLIYSMNGTATTFAGSTSNGVYVWGAQLVEGTTAQTYLPTTDRLNVPRLTYQNGGGGYPSLLLEKQSTNLFPNSQTTNAWSLTNMSRTANYGISPDGTQNADLLFPTTSGSVSFQSDITTSSLVIGQPFVVSFFIKLNASFTSDAGTNILDIRLSGPTVWSRPTVRINLETGAVTNINNAIYISSTNFGNGWFRITFGATPTGTSGQVALQLPTTVTMNGGSFYIWGLQGEANTTYATSYIPTTSSSATRVADACFKTGISSLIGQTEGTMFVEVDLSITGGTNRLISINDGTAFGNINMLSFSPTNRFQYEASPVNILSSVYPAGRYKVAVVYSALGASIWVNGSEVATTTTATTTTGYTKFFVGDSPYGVGEYKEIAQAILFPTRLTNAELASLTTL